MIGLVGLGMMGRPMARRLADAGYVVKAYDNSLAAVEALGEVRGVVICERVTEVANGSDAVILMLPSSDFVESVLLGDGLLAAIDSSCLLVDMGSSEPARTKALAALAAERGVQLLDAPVSGGVIGAETGTLTVMVGGPVEGFAALGPVLGALGSTVRHAGQVVGAGHAVKALNNLMSATHLLASSEAMLAAERFGLDVDVVLEIVNGSSGMSGSTMNKWPKFVRPGTFDTGFSLRLMLKDMRAGLSLENDLGVPAPVSRAAVDAWTAAADELAPTADHTEIVRWLQAHLRTTGSDHTEEHR